MTQDNDYVEFTASGIEWIDQVRDVLDEHEMEPESIRFRDGQIVEFVWDLGK